MKAAFEPSRQYRQTTKTKHTGENQKKNNFDNLWHARKQLMTTKIQRKRIYGILVNFFEKQG